MLVSLAEHVGIAIGRARLHTAVRESEERYRELVEKQGEGVNVADAADNFSFANPAAHVIFGVPPGSLVGRNLGEFVDDENLLTFRTQTDLRRVGRASAYEIAIRRPDGERRNLLVTATPRHDAEGRFTGTFAVFRDITERKRLEEALRASEATYRAIFDAANDAIFVHDLETGLVLDLNQKGRDMYGLGAESVKGTSVAELSAGVPPYSAAEASAYLAEAAAGKPQMYEWLARNRSGRTFWVEVSLKRATVGQHERILALVRDISERKRLENQLLQAQKMQIVGQLAGGIAHDFNNLLTAMVGYAEFAKQGLEADHPVRSDIDEVLRSAHRAAQLTAQLLSFSRRQVIAPQVTDLNALLTDMRKMQIGRAHV
jgi:PAS domain S-box-containing protein